MKQSPKIVCLCGSTSFSDAFQKANIERTLAGEIVLTVGCDFRYRDSLYLEESVKADLDELHLRKIDLANYVLILNVDGYIGESTKRELAYAIYTGKRVQFLNQEYGEAFMNENSHAIGKQVIEFAISMPRT